MEDEKFEFWAIVEIFGHTTIAGYVSQGPGELIRIDVPECNGQPKFTKFYGPKAIYGITPTTEEICKKAAEKLSVRPVSLWVVPNRALPAPGADGGMIIAEGWQDQEEDNGPPF